jgi:hypothetical protein
MGAKSRRHSLNWQHNVDDAAFLGKYRKQISNRNRSRAMIKVRVQLLFDDVGARFNVQFWAILPKVHC